MDIPGRNALHVPGGAQGRVRDASIFTDEFRPVSYLSQSEIAANYALTQRVAQSAAQETLSDPDAQDPDAWAYEHRRAWAAQPGWDGAWESARVSNPSADYDPGKDQGVITDGMILSAVQSMLAE